MSTHIHGPICIYPSLSQPRAGNICLPELREWVGVKAMTASMFLVRCEFASWEDTVQPL